MSGATSPAPGAIPKWSAGPVLAFARVTFTDLLAYRLRYLFGVLNYVIYIAVQYFLWAAVYASRPLGSVDGGGEFGGYAFEELVTYFAVGWVVRVTYFNNIDREIAERVTRGDVILDLLRPVSLLECYYGQALGEAAMRLFLMALPSALVVFPLFSVTAPSLPEGAAGAGVAAAFVLSAVLAFHVFFLVNFVIGALTVFFEKIPGLLWTKFLVIQLLSGLLAPFDLFPGWARALLEVLPFRAITYGPVSIYVGKAQGARLALELGLQVFWVLALWLFARWLWGRCRRKLLVFGG